MRTLPWLVLCAAVVGCGEGALMLDEAGDELMSGEAPLLGADGKDAADRGCQVVLRQVSRPPGATGGYQTECTSAGCFYVWAGSLEVSAQAVSEGVKPYVLYRSGSSSNWLQVAASKVSGAPAGFQRYNFRLRKGTVSAGTSTTSLMNTRLEVSPFIRTVNKARLFDHNRVPGEFDTYVLNSANGWSVKEDPSVCQPPAPPPANRAVLEFLPGWRQVQHGALVSGGKLTLEYAIERLPDCRGTHNGFPAWDLIASVRFQPGGELREGSVRRFATPMGIPQGPGLSAPLEVTVPAGATRAEVWFRNFSGAGSSCVAYDSNNGQNYGFEVVRPPAAVGWAGSFGGSFSRECTHRDGLAEPVVLDSYIQQRACTFVEADVWVPGLTDAPIEHPERLLAQVEVSADGQPATTAWLSYAGRVGNDYRFRWELPRDTLGREYWNTLRYRFGFSTDGASWTWAGQGAVPGGAPRSIERDPSWCNPAWASCAR